MASAGGLTANGGQALYQIKDLTKDTNIESVLSNASTINKAADIIEKGGVTQINLPGLGTYTTNQLRDIAKGGKQGNKTTEVFQLVNALNNMSTRGIGVLNEANTEAYKISAGVDEKYRTYMPNTFTNYQVKEKALGMTNSNKVVTSTQSYEYIDHLGNVVGSLAGANITNVSPIMGSNEEKYNGTVMWEITGTRKNPYTKMEQPFVIKATPRDAITANNDKKAILKALYHDYDKQAPEEKARTHQASIALQNDLDIQEAKNFEEKHRVNLGDSKEFIPTRGTGESILPVKGPDGSQYSIELLRVTPYKSEFVIYKAGGDNPYSNLTPIEVNVNGKKAINFEAKDINAAIDIFSNSIK